MRLSAVLDVELERGMPLMEPLDEADDVRLLVPDEQRQNVVRLGEQPFRNSGSDLVEIRAVVTDKQGKVITNLGKDDFEIIEGGHNQAVSFFSAEDLKVERRPAVAQSR